jgi:sec-independent protein translocase protein TatC
MAQQVTTPTGPAGPQEDGMTLLDHVRELRDRLFKAVIALVIGTAVGLALSERILQLLLVPYQRQLLVTSPTEALTNVFIVSLTFGAALALPVIVYQILAFIMPGLYPNERKWIYVGVPFGFIMFILGALFAYFIMLPAAVGFLTSIFPTLFNYNLTPDAYIPFVAGVMFWMGVAFEMPLLIFILAKLNIINGRVLGRQWRIAIVVIAIIAAFVTPTPDPINMSIVMVPLLLLYGFSIVLAYVARRNAVTPAMLDPEEKIEN